MFLLLYFNFFVMEDFIYPINVDNMNRTSIGSYKLSYLKIYNRGY